MKVRINHTTKEGKRIQKNITLDDNVANTLKNNGKIMYDTTNDSFKFYDYTTGTKVSLPTAVTKVLKKRVTASRVTRINTEKHDYTIENIAF